MRTVTWITLAAIATVSVARADGPSDADRLFDEGRSLAKAGKYAEACERFTRSYQLDHAVGTELNLGDCHEQLGHLREAWHFFDQAAQEFDRTGNAARAKFARGRADAVAAKLVEVIVRVAEPRRDGLEITIGGRSAQPAAEIRDRVEPGPIEVTARAPGRAPFTKTEHGDAGGSVTIDIPALAGAHEPPPAAGHEGSRRRPRLRLALVLGGAAGASAITGLALGLIGRSDWNSAADGTHCMRIAGGITCDNTGSEQIHSAQRLADIGTGFALASAVLAGAAAVVYFTAPADSVVVSPTANGQGVGLAAFGRF
ncbi:MAG: tetratricopeptide repeat protein [Acidobacteriota bacterium]